MAEEFNADEFKGNVGILREAVRFPLQSHQKAPKFELVIETTYSTSKFNVIDPDINVLLGNEVAALMKQIAYVETGNDPSYRSGQRLGRYGTHVRTLINYGYLSGDGSTWTGLNGMYSLNDFLTSKNTQHRITEQFLQDQYESLIRSGAIISSDTKEVIAGLLAVAHQFQDTILEAPPYTPTEEFSISSISRTSNTVTANTYPVAHTYGNGRSVTVSSSSDSQLNGAYSIWIPNAETLDPGNVYVASEYEIAYTSVGSNVTYSSDSGTLSSLAFYPLANIIPITSTTANVRVNSSRTLFNQGQKVEIGNVNVSGVNGTYVIENISLEGNILFQINASVSTTATQGYARRIVNFNTPQLASTSANLIYNLRQTIKNNGTSVQARQHYVNSGLADLTISQNSIEQRHLKSIVSVFNKAADNITSWVEYAMRANVTGQNKVDAISNAELVIFSFDLRRKDMISSFPSSRAKEWRENGGIVDSLGRFPGTFYNAGKYAITTMAT